MRISTHANSIAKNENNKLTLTTLIQEKDGCRHALIFVLKFGDETQV